jgi:predicted MFS family arabinose efflux permease
VRTTWRVLAGHRDFRLVLAGGVVSQTGDWILLVGLMYRVYAMTGSTVATGLTLLSSLVPQVLLGTIAGVFVDRWDRRRTMIIADLLLAAGLLPLLAVHGAGQVWIVCVVLAWEAAVEQLFTPAQLAFIPALVPEDRLVAANALNGQVSDVSRLAGSGLGGLIAAVGGLTAVTLSDAASFLVSAGLLVLVRARVPAGARARSQAPGQPEPEPGERLKAIGSELRDGLRLAAKHPFLRALLLYGLITSVGENIMLTLFAPFVREVLHGTSEDYGLVNAAQAIGGIVGGLFAVSLSQRFSATRLFTVSAVVFGVIDLGIFLYPLGYVALWPAIVGMVVVGLPSALNLAALITLFQQSTEDAYRGRIFGAMSAVFSVGALAGPLAGGYLSGALGIVPVIAVQGAGYVLAGLAMTVALRSSDPAPRPASPQIAKGRLISYN